MVVYLSSTCWHRICISLRVTTWAENSAHNEFCQYNMENNRICAAATSQLCVPCACLPVTFDKLPAGIQPLCETALEYCEFAGCLCACTIGNFADRLSGLAPAGQAAGAREGFTLSWRTVAADSGCHPENLW